MKLISIDNQTRASEYNVLDRVEATTGVSYRNLAKIGKLVQILLIVVAFAVGIPIVLVTIVAGGFLLFGSGVWLQWLVIGAVIGLIALIGYFYDKAKKN